MTVSRRQVVRACKQRGWTIQPGALKGIEVNSKDEDELHDILDGLAARVDKTVTNAVWEAFLEESSDDVQSKKKAEVTILSAFQTPKLVYEVMRKQFRVDETEKSVFGSADDKVDMLAQRYALIQQRLLRHELFRPNDLGRANRSQHKLTPIESLLGGVKQNPILILGILVQIEEGQYYLEDPTGQVPVSFQDAAAVDGFFVTEHCILLVEGSFHDGILYIHRLGHPLLEPRAVSLAAIQQQLSHPAYYHHRIFEVDPSLVLLSDVHLDQPIVLQQLEGIFASYENYSADRLPLFCLMGNFTSQSHLLLGPELRQSLDELGNLISRFPRLAQDAHFVLIPGPRDGVGPVLPLPPLSHSLGRVQHVHWATNPCRIRWRNREMVLFRYDLLHLMQRHQILLQETSIATMDDDDDVDAAHLRLPHCRLVKTILDQGHLVPTGAPIFWNYDHALRLYPLPDVLVLAGNEPAYHEIYGQCHVIHPGSMMNDGSYALYSRDEDVHVEFRNTIGADFKDG